MTVRERDRGVAVMLIAGKAALWGRASPSVRYSP